jgi:threonine/homoserine/homoserine lactone efflux protein
MTDTGSYLVTGVVLGLSAGLAPGPLLALVLSETLRLGIRAGLSVALAPLATDLPIVLGSLMILARLSQFNLVLALVALFGALFIAYLGIDMLRLQGGIEPVPARRPESFKRGVITNLLNPHPYLFWLGVGAPTVLKASRGGWAGPLLFIAGFYVCIIGSKIVLAMLAARFRNILTSRGYLLLMKSLGLVMLCFALLFLREGLELLGLL